MNETIKMILLGGCAYMGVTGFVEIAQTVEYTPLTPVQKIVIAGFCAIAYSLLKNADLVNPDEDKKDEKI